VKTTVVGIGNVLLSDDGIGVWVIRRLLAAYRFAPDVEILDGGTLGLSLASYLAGTDRLLIVDAVANGAAPGTVVVMHGNEVPATLRAALSAHEASLCDLLAALTLLGTMPHAFVAIGVTPAHTEPSLELSPPVRAALASAERAAIEQLERWGIAVEALDVPPEPVLTL
jgi:hydrogenase maturation protease